jgi:hypothetical protein
MLFAVATTMLIMGPGVEDVVVSHISTNPGSVWVYLERRRVARVSRQSPGAGYRAVTLPGVIPPPPTSASIPSGAAQKIEVTDSSELSVTLRDFFAAWLTGHGDLSRVADTAAIPVFAAPPHASVHVISAYTGTQLPQDASGSIAVWATVLATETATAEISYTLQLSASAGRWIVTSVSAAPILGGQK